METKPGYLTTEFWITVLTVVGAVALAIADKLPERYASLIAAVSAGAYAIARGLAKQGVKPDSPPS